MLAVQFNIQSSLNYALVFLALVGGLVAGLLATRMVIFSFDSDGVYLAESQAVPVVLPPPQEDDLQIILQRSLFNAAAVGSTLERVSLSDVVSPVDDSESSQTAVAAINLDNYTLLGTVVAGGDSLALIQSGSEVGIHGLGSELTTGVMITGIERRLVVLMARGERYELPLVEQQQQEAPSRTAARGAATRAPVAATAAATANVVDLGDGRYRVDRAMVDSARANMGTLLQSARMIPHLENDQTVGFRLVGMQRGSLLEQLGLRLGDVIMEINRVKLDSPEKALQVFQQVREANNISLGLVRDGQPQTFEYSFE